MPSEMRTLDIPYENYVGIVLRGDQRTYVIVSRCLEDGDLLIYHVVNIDFDGEHCEAQVFFRYRLPIKLYLSRKRRIQRLKRSNNLRDEFELNDAIIVISRIPEEGLGRHQNCQLAKRTNAWCKLSKEQFPPLPSPLSHNLDVSLPSQQPDSRYPSYAEAASLPQRRIHTNCPVEYLSKTKEGIKQRERRREERLLRKNRHSWPGTECPENQVSTDLWVPLKQSSGRGRSCPPFTTTASSVC